MANRVMFCRLDAIVIIGRDMAPKLLAYPKVNMSMISLIPNWATMPIYYRELSSENPYRRLCGGSFVVAMSGNAGFTHDPMSVFEAARLLKDNKDIKFLLSGEGVGWTKIKEMQEASPIPNVTLVERVSEAELESFLSAGDVWIVPYRKNNTGVSVPSRIYNIFAIGRPIILCSEPDAEAAILLRRREHRLGHSPGRSKSARGRHCFGGVSSDDYHGKGTPGRACCVLLHRADRARRLPQSHGSAAQASEGPQQRETAAGRLTGRPPGRHKSTSPQNR